MTGKAESDPRQHTRKMAAHLKETINRLCEDIEKVEEPQVKAMVKAMFKATVEAMVEAMVETMFETSAEVLSGLEKA